MKKLFFILCTSACLAQQTDQYKQILLSKQLGKEVRLYSKGYGIVSEDTRLSIIDSLGSVTFTYPYKSEISRLSKNRFVLRPKEGNANGKTALIDPLGNKLIPFDVFKLKTWENNDRIIYSKDGKDRVLDYNGKVIIPSFDKVEFAGENRVFVKKGKSWLIYNFDGQLVSNREFKENLYFYKGRAYVNTGSKKGEVIDHNGHVLSTISDHYVDGIIGYPFIITKNIPKNKFGIIDEYENILADEVYDQAFVGTENIYLVKDNKVNIFSKKDKKIYPTRFGYVNHLFGGLFRTVPDRKNPKVAVIRIDGELVLPQEYDTVDPIKISGDDFIYLKKNKKATILDRNLKSVVDEGYEIKQIFPNHLILKKEDTFYSFSPEDKNYRKLENILSVKPSVLIPGLIYQDKEYYYGIMDEEGNEIIPNKYDDIITFLSAREIVIKKDKKYGVTNHKNEPLKEVIYDNYSSDNKGIKLTKGQTVEYLYFTYPKDKERLE